MKELFWQGKELNLSERKSTSRNALTFGLIHGVSTSSASTIIMSSETASPPRQDPEPQAEQKPGMHVVESTAEIHTFRRNTVSSIKGWV